ncbi:response regulator transcription factor [Trinickia mobilis]|uniref:response regulator transcription factor n=1 Tax=Trinickia mobilis TaxID=2816356 RepID=UPI001A8C36AD|nr:response regulator transcription factor [Trinickia mobilis]
MKNTIRIIVADDHPSVCLGITSLFSAVPKFSVVGQASDAQSLAECLDAYPCDIIVSDVGMPGLNGESNAISLLRTVLRRRLRPYVIVLTMINHSQMLTGLLQMGVSAIIDKRDAAESLILAVESIGTGQPYLSEHVLDTIGTTDGFPAFRAGVLTRREWEVFQLYAKGMAIHQIAKHLGRSGKTISTQKRSTMRKLGLDTEAQLIEYARQIGLT